MPWKATLFPGIALCVVICSKTGVAQQPFAAARPGSDASVTVPRLIKFAGTIPNAQGTVAVTFSLYADQSGGEALWQETQNVSVDEKGDYTAYLGATYSAGMPLDLFQSGEARWLSVQPQGQLDLPRILLASVPYAAKAGDAETLGGLPASAFALANGTNSSARAIGSSVAESASSPSISPAMIAHPEQSGSGTQYPIPDYQSPYTLGPSNITADSTGNDLTVPGTATASSFSGTTGTFGTLTSLGYLLLNDNTSPTLAPEVHLSGYNQSWLSPGIDVANNPTSTDLVMAGMRNYSGTVTDLIYLRRNKAGDGSITDDSGFPTLGVFCTPPSTAAALQVCNSAQSPARDLVDLISPPSFSGNYLAFINDSGTLTATFNSTGTSNGSDFQVSVVSATSGTPNTVLQSNHGTSLIVGDNSAPAYNWGGTLNLDQAGGGSVIFGNSSGRGFASADGAGTYFGSVSGHPIYFKLNNVAMATLTSAGNFGIGTTTPSALLSVGPSSQFQVGSSGAITTTGGLAVTGGAVSLPAGAIANSALQGSGAVTVTAGAGLSGGGVAALGGSTTLSLPNVGTAGTYGSATQVPVLTTDAYGRITGVANTAISGSGGSSVWSALTGPTANLALSTGPYTTTFTAGSSTGTGNLFNFADTASNTGTGDLVKIATAANSTLNPFAVYAAGASNPSIAVLPNGEVGIGTTTPSNPLSVAGSIGATGAITGSGLSTSNPTDNSTVIYIHDTSTNSVSFGAVQNSTANTGVATKNLTWGSSSGGSDLVFGPSTAAPTALVLKANGNIGIGTTSPSALLSVGLSSQFQVGSSGAITTTGGLAVTGGAVSLPAGAIANSALQGSGAVTVTAGAGLSGGGVAALGGSTTLSLPNVGTAGTYGSATQVPVLTTDAYGRITGVANTAISFSAPAWSALASPIANLALSTGSYTTTFTAGSSTGTGNLFNFADTASNTGTGDLVNIATAANSTLNPFAVYAAGALNPSIAVLPNSYVGVGTATPGAQLEVNGTAQFDQGVTFQQPVTLPGVTVTGTAQFNQNATFEQPVAVPSLSVNGGGQAKFTGNLTITGLTGASLLGTDSNGNIINNSSATLSNNTTGNAATATTAVTATTAATATTAVTATTAATATNLASGSTGSIPYQSAAGATAMLSANTAATDQVLVSHGTGSAGAAPALTNAPALSMANMTGVPPNVHTFLATGQTASYNSGNWYTFTTSGPTSTAQLWELSASVYQDSSVTCTSYGTVKVSLEWTDARGVMQTTSSTMTFAATPPAGFPVNLGPSGMINVSPNTNILVRALYLAGTGCTGSGSTYTATAKAVQLQ